MIRTVMVLALSLALFTACSIHPEGSDVLGRDQTSLLARHYKSGETIRYEMTAYNATGPTPETYTAKAFGNVAVISGGVYQETFQWQDLVIDNAVTTLTPESQSYRQLLSLDQRFVLPYPTGVEFQRELAGPVYDLMSFYADLRIGTRSGRLNHAGDNDYVKFPKPNSWAKTSPDFVIAEDCIDFDLTLQGIDQQARQATLLVRHVPPPNSCVNLPSPWMNVPVSDKPNNWVQVTRISDGFLVEVGREDFDDLITVDLDTGRILKASMHNPLNTVERTCTDDKLTQCGPVTKHPDRVRRIQITGSSVSPLTRHYTSGEKINYTMTGRNQDNAEVHTYSVTSSATVASDQSGAMFETSEWSDLVHDGQSVTLDAASLSFRQKGSLDPVFNTPGHYPDQHGIDPRLWAPSDDLFNIYVDLWGAVQSPRLLSVGDHVFRSNLPGMIFLGHQAETFLDLDYTLRRVDIDSGTAVLDIKHLPPATPRASFPAEWMKIPVNESKTPNNIWWVKPLTDGTSVVSVGSETINIEITIEIGSGKIRNASLVDSIQFVQRICRNKVYSDCQASVSHQQVRNITLTTAASSCSK